MCLVTIGLQIYELFYKAKSKKRHRIKRHRYLKQFFYFFLQFNVDGLEHVLGTENLVELFLGEQVVLEDQFVDTATGFAGLLGNLGGLLVANDGVEHGDDADAAFNQLAATLYVGHDAFDAVLAQGVKAVGEQVDGLEEAVGDDGFHHVQFELTVVGGKGDGHVVADHLIAHLVHHFGDDRVDLARHDGRTGLAFGQVDLVEAAARAGTHQTEVVAHLIDLDAEALHGRAVLDHAARCTGGFDEVVGQMDAPSRNLAQGLDA